MSSVDTNALRELVAAVHDDIVELAKQLTAQSTDQQHTQLIDELLEYIENISTMAEMMGLNGLHQLSAQLQSCIADGSLSDNDAGSIEQALLNWINGIAKYLSTTNDQSSIEELLACLPTRYHCDIETALREDMDRLQPIDPTHNAAEPEVEDTPIMDEQEDENLDDDWDDDLAESDNVLALFAYEMSLMMEQIAQAAHSLTQQESTQQPYSTLLQRILSTSEDIGLAGISYVCRFIEENLKLLPTISAQQFTESVHCFATWPATLIPYLENPEDDQTCLDIVDCLEDQHWPKPLAYREVRALLEGLAQTTSADEQWHSQRNTEVNAEDVTLDIDADVSQQLIDSFIAEAPAQATALSTYTGYIGQGQQVEQNTQAALRIVHTLKGSAQLIGVKGVANISHHLEDIFEHLVSKDQAPCAELTHTLQEAADMIEVMIEALQGLSAPPLDAQHVLHDVLKWASRIDRGEEVTSASNDDVAFTSAAVNQLESQDNHLSLAEAGSNVAQATSTTDQLRQPVDTNLSQPPAELQPDAAEPSSSAKLLRVPKETIDEIFNIVGETSIAISRLQEQLRLVHHHGDILKQQDYSLQTRQSELENVVNIQTLANRHRHSSHVKNTHNHSDDNTFDSLELDEYDEYYSTIQRFIEVVADNRQASHDVFGQIGTLENLARQQQMLNRTLQDLVMTTRLESIKMIVPRLQRVVRQACRATGKKVDLLVIGEQLRIDGDVLNKLVDPLMHILRNAVDHGIESTEQRLAANKDETGTITLTLRQDGNNISVICADDGRGLDYERIRQTAIRRGLLTETDQADKSWLARQILQPGFSTRETTTELSGRGVGMDMVYESILRLKGSIEIKDGEHHGTRFCLLLPLPLLTSHCLLVQSEQQRYAIPTQSLSHILSPGQGTFEFIGKALTYSHSGNIYQTCALSSLLGSTSNKETQQYQQCAVLLSQLAGAYSAIIVEGVIASYKLVVKSLGHFIPQLNGVTGVAQLGDGSVVPVINIAQLANIQPHSEHSTEHSTEQLNNVTASLRQAHVLIVDDSLSVRSSLKQLLSDAGFETALARDGIEALEMISKHQPDIVLTDLEMPRMTGLELTSHIRREALTKHLPVIMVTSRTAQKHRKLAQQAGVSHYLSKPFSEDQLLQIIESELVLS